MLALEKLKTRKKTTIPRINQTSRKLRLHIKANDLPFDQKINFLATNKPEYPACKTASSELYLTGQQQ